MIKELVRSRYNNQFCVRRSCKEYKWKDEVILQITELFLIEKDKDLDVGRIIRDAVQKKKFLKINLEIYFCHIFAIILILMITICDLL